MSIGDESVKVAVYNAVGVVSLSSFLNANKYHSHVLNQKEKRWYLYEEDEKASQAAVESPSKTAYILVY